MSVDVPQRLQSRSVLLLMLAAATAALQLAIATRWEGRADHLMALVAGWGGALWLAWLDRAHRPGRPVGAMAGTLGIALVVTTWVLALRGRGDYALQARFLPLAAGLGLALSAGGVRALRAFWRELALLALSLAYPLPFLIRELFQPTTFTAAVAAGALRLAGFAVERRGTLLLFPDSTLRVFDACSGIFLMSQLALLAALVACLLPMTRRQAALVLLTGAISGFLVNAARIAMLGAVAARAPGQFHYWESYVTSSILFPVIATALAGTVWWVILHRRRAHVVEVTTA